MLVHPVVNNASPPFNATFTSDGGKLLVQFAGSGWRGSVGKISVDLLMDGNVIATASVFTNEVNSHKALVPVAVLISAAAGPHTFSVAPSSGSTKIDQNDYFTVTATETTPNYFETGALETGYLTDSGWTLATPGSAGGGGREWVKTITFSKAFNMPPKVMIALSMLDIGVDANIRARMWTQNITEESFDLVYSTWDNTTVFTLGANWLAFGDAQ